MRAANHPTLFVSHRDEVEAEGSLRWNRDVLERRDGSEFGDVGRPVHGINSPIRAALVPRLVSEPEGLPACDACVLSGRDVKREFLFDVVVAARLGSPHSS